MSQAGYSLLGYVPGYSSCYSKCQHEKWSKNVYCSHALSSPLVQIVLKKQVMYSVLAVPSKTSVEAVYFRLCTLNSSQVLYWKKFYLKYRVFFNVLVCSVYLFSFYLVVLSLFAQSKASLNCPCLFYTEWKKSNWWKRFCTSDLVNLHCIGVSWRLTILLTANSSHSFV